MNTLKNKKGWYIILPLLFFVTSGSWLGGCGTEADLRECPDTSFSQTNLDTLEAQNPAFIWRICNANEEYAIENLVIDSNWNLKTLESCTCSQYYSSIFNSVDTEFPIEEVTYRQNGESYSHIYMASRNINEGLTDSTVTIWKTPGRYTYFFSYRKDTSRPEQEWVTIKIKHEAIY